MVNWGAVPLGAVLPFPFASYGKTNGESITLTGLAITDVEIYKGATVTQRASDAGVVLLDTDGIDIDGITGIHGFTIDTGDNADAGFYAAGGYYWIVVSAVTIDAQTVNFVAGTFHLIAADQTGDAFARLGAPAGASIAADVAAVEAQTDDIGAAGAGLTALATQTSVNDVKTQTDKLVFTVANKVDANVLAINGSATAAQNLERSALAIYRGSVTGAATTTTLVDSGLTQSGTDHLKGRVVIFTTGALALQATDITGFTPASDTLTFTALTAAPSAADQYVIV